MKLSFIRDENGDQLLVKGKSSVDSWRDFLLCTYLIYPSALIIVLLNSNVLDEQICPYLSNVGILRSRMEAMLNRHVKPYKKTLMMRDSPLCCVRGAGQMMIRCKV